MPTRNDNQLAPNRGTSPDIRHTRRLLRSRTGLLITAGFGLTLCLFIVVLAFGLRQVNEIHNSVHDIVDTNNTKEYLIRRMHNAARERLLNSFRMFGTDDPFLQEDIGEAIRLKGGQYLSARQRLVAMPLSDDERRILLAIDQTASAAAPLMREAADTLIDGNPDTARSLLTDKALPSQDLLLAALDALSQTQRREAEQTLSAIDIRHRHAFELMTSLGLIGIVLGLIIAVVVTRRVLRSEERLFKQKELAEVTLQSISDGVITLNNNQEVIYLNRSASSLLQTRVERARGHRLEQLAEFRDVDSGKPIENPLTRAMSMAEQTAKHPGLSYLAGEDDKRIWLNSYAAGLHNLDGQQTGAVFVIRDVTDTINSERRLRELNANLESRVTRRTQALARTNAELQNTVDTLQETQAQLIQSEKMAALGGLVAGISHEVNTPIGIAVTAGSDIAEKVTEVNRAFNDGSLTKQAMGHYLEHTIEACRIMLANLNRASELIRSFKQVAVDQTSDSCRQIALHAYCDEILISLHPKWKHRPIKVINDCDKHALIYTKPGVLYQVISNLLVNSLIHGYPDNQTPGEIHLRATHHDDMTTIDYTDDGCGIPPDHLVKIFDPFFTTRRGQGGSGLGLNIVYNLVTAKLHGKITAWNREEGGVHFQIRFRDMQQEPADAHAS